MAESKEELKILLMKVKEESEKADLKVNILASSHITSVWILSLELEKEMATHSNVLAWRIPGTGEPDGLLSMGSHRVRHN